MLGFFKKFAQNRTVKELREIVDRINALEPEIQKLSDEEIKNRSAELKQKAKDGSELNELLPEAFACVREASKRTLGQRPFDVQLMGGIVLHRGGVAEMMTGEGKTLAAVAPTYLNALSGKGAHVVTVNEYLARRDAVWMGQIYRALGLSVACLVPNAAYLYDPSFKAAPEETGGKESALLDKERDTTGSFLVQQDYLRLISRREAYLADITYGTNHEFGFDYLRDNLAYALTQQAQQEHNFAIIDEVDSILIDEARTPLIIAAPDSQSSEYYRTFARIADRLEPEADYIVDEKKRTVSINDSGISKVEKMVGVQNLYDSQNLRLVHYLEESLKAKTLFHLDKDYVVKNGEILIVDEFTGRILHGRRYSGGLHQAIEAKEGVKVQEESRTYARISIQNYFRMYKKIAGMTGTAQTSAEEFHKVYSLEVVAIPPNRQLVRQDLSDVIYKTFDAKMDAIVLDIEERRKKGQPVLVGTASIEKNERLAKKLRDAGIPHELLNAKNNEREGAIIAQAGRAGAVTIATNMAGRGVDIILGGNPPKPEEASAVRALGGLYVIGTERHEARRIDNQLRGRAGRQGDPGSSRFFLSLEDDLMRIFGGDRIKGLMERLDMPDDQPIEIGFVGSAVAQAQAKVEGANFDMRKHLLEYDDVLNKQRTSVYKRRQTILSALNKDDLANLIFESSQNHLEKLFAAEDAAQNEKPTAHETGESVAPAFDLKKILVDSGLIDKNFQSISNDKNDQIGSREELQAILVKKSAEAGTSSTAVQKLLSILDMLWMNHLEDLDALSESVGLRAYGQHDPLAEYREESRRLFRGFWDNYNEWVFSNLFRLAQNNADSARTNAEIPRSSASKSLPAGRQERESAIDNVPRQSAFSPRSSAADKVGRNDPCPCGAKHEDGRPVKYKHCHGNNL